MFQVIKKLTGEMLKLHQVTAGYSLAGHPVKKRNISYITTFTIRYIQ